MVLKLRTLVLVIFLTSCKSINNINKSVFVNNLECPDFIHGNCFKEVRQVEKTYFWWVFCKQKSNIIGCQCVDIFNSEGRFLGKYYYHLIDLSIYTEKQYFESVLNNDINFEFFEIDSLHFEDSELIAFVGDKSYLMKEYLPRDQNPLDPRRYMYFNWDYSLLGLNHGALIEDIGSDFSYRWRTIDSVEIKNDETLVFCSVYNLKGKYIDAIKFSLSGKVIIDTTTYSFYKSLFEDNYIFYSSGKYYPMRKINFLSTGVIIRE